MYDPVSVIAFTGSEPIPMVEACTRFGSQQVVISLGPTCIPLPAGPGGACTSAPHRLVHTSALKVFAQKVDQFIGVLPTVEEEKTILPVNGEQGYHWRPEVEIAVKEEMVACFARAAEAMVCLKMNASSYVVIIIIQSCNFLQDSAWEHKIQSRI